MLAGADYSLRLAGPLHPAPLPPEPLSGLQTAPRWLPRHGVQPTGRLSTYCLRSTTKIEPQNRKNWKFPPKFLIEFLKKSFLKNVLQFEYLPFSSHLRLDLTPVSVAGHISLVYRKSGAGIPLSGPYALWPPLLP